MSDIKKRKQSPGLKPWETSSLPLDTIDPNDLNDPTAFIESIHKVSSPDDNSYTVVKSLQGNENSVGDILPGDPSPLPPSQRILNKTLPPTSPVVARSPSAPLWERELAIQFDPQRPWPQSSHSSVDPHFNPTGNLNEPVHDTLPTSFGSRAILEAIYTPLTPEEEQAVLSARSNLPLLRPRHYTNSNSINVVELKLTVASTNLTPGCTPTTFLRELDFRLKQLLHRLEIDPPTEKQLLRHPKSKRNESDAARREFEEAKQAWRDAVAHRKSVLAQLDAEVKEARERMRALDPSRHD